MSACTAEAMDREDKESWRVKLIIGEQLYEYYRQVRNYLYLGRQ
jgi:hypothetical protein